MATTKSRQDPNHPRWKRAESVELVEEKIGKGFATKYLLHLNITRKDGKAFQITFTKIRGREAYCRDIISHSPKVTRIVRSHMPRIGAGTGQTERKPVKTVTEYYDNPAYFLNGKRGERGLSPNVERYEYRREEIEEMGRQILEWK